MTADEMRAERAALERDIAALAAGFVERVGLPIESINVRVVDSRWVSDGHDRSVVAGVDVVVRL